MKVEIPLNIPEEVVNLILDKTKKEGLTVPKNKKNFVIKVMKCIIDHNLLVYTHEGMKDSVEMYLDENADVLQDLI